MEAEDSSQQGAAWEAFGGPCRALRVAREADGNLVVFGLRTDDSLWQRRQSAHSGAWSEWTRVVERVRGVDVAMDQRGRLALVVVDVEGACWQLSQSFPYGAWGYPRELGIEASQIAAVCRYDGRFVAAALAGDQVYVSEQTRPGGAWGEWSLLGGGYTRILMTRNGFGQPIVFGVAADPAIDWTIQRGTRWDPWMILADKFAELSPDIGPDGRLHVACVDAEGGLHHRREARQGLDWGEWTRLPAEGTAVVAMFRSAGAYEVYGLDRAGAALRVRRTGGAWGAREELGGGGFVHLEAYEDATGRLELFAVAGAGELLRRSVGP